MANDNGNEVVDKPLAVPPGEHDPNAFKDAPPVENFTADQHAEATTESQREFVRQAVEDAKEKYDKKPKP